MSFRIETGEQFRQRSLLHIPYRNALTDVNIAKRVNVNSTLVRKVLAQTFVKFNPGLCRQSLNKFLHSSTFELNSTSDNGLPFPLNFIQIFLWVFYSNLTDWQAKIFCSLVSVFGKVLLILAIMVGARANGFLITQKV